MALAAGETERAADLIEAAAPDAIARGEQSTVARWLVRLPDELARARPRLALATAWGLGLDGRVGGIEGWLQRVEAAPDAAAFAGEVAAVARANLVRARPAQHHPLATGPGAVAGGSAVRARGGGAEPRDGPLADRRDDSDRGGAGRGDHRNGRNLGTVSCWRPPSGLSRRFARRRHGYPRRSSSTSARCA